MDQPDLRNALAYEIGRLTPRTGAPPCGFIGVAVFPQHGANNEALLKSADVALYRAKLERCDRVVVADKS